MRIGCTADLHYGIDAWSDRRVERFIDETIAPAELDLLIVAGDLAETAGLSGEAIGSRHVAILARLRAAVRRAVAFCAGNHDIWSTDPAIDSFRIYRDRLAEVARGAGVTYLDHENLGLGDMAIVGCYGHYDYSLRAKDLCIGGAPVTDEHYRRQTPPGYQQPVWMDSQMIYWDWSDATACAEICRLGLARLESALAFARRILFVSHGVPRNEVNGHVGGHDPVSQFLNAFSGTDRLERLIRVATGRGSQVISVSGHTHKAVERVTIDGADYLNVGGTYGKPRLVVLELAAPAAV